MFVKEIDIILTCSLGMQVFLRSKEVSGESGWRKVSPHLVKALSFQSRTHFPPAQSPVSQLSKFSGYWEPQDVSLTSPNVPGFPDPHFGPTASNPSRWLGEQV